MSAVACASKPSTRASQGYRIITAVLKSETTTMTSAVSRSNPSRRGATEEAATFDEFDPSWSPADGEFVHHCPTHAIVPHVQERATQPTESRPRLAG